MGKNKNFSSGEGFEDFCLQRETESGIQDDAGNLLFFPKRMFMAIKIDLGLPMTLKKELFL